MADSILYVFGNMCEAVHVLTLENQQKNNIKLLSSS